MIGQAGQGGLGLPDRDYYTKDDDKSKQIRAQYVQHIAKMFAASRRRARHGGSRSQYRDGHRDANRQGIQDARRAARSRKQLPQNDARRTASAHARFLLAILFQDIGFPDIREVNVGQPEFFQALDKQLTSVPLADWKTYLRWHVIHASVRALSSKFVNEDFDFYGRTLTGTKELQPRWRRCSGATDRDLGEALGQKYVAQAFPPEAKEQARQMVQNLVAALRADIATLPWMSPETRQQALAKLSAMTVEDRLPG